MLVPTPTSSDGFRSKNQACQAASPKSRDLHQTCQTGTGALGFSESKQNWRLDVGTPGASNGRRRRFDRLTSVSASTARAFRSSEASASIRGREEFFTELGLSFCCGTQIVFVWVLCFQCCNKGNQKDNCYFKGPAGLVGDLRETRRTTAIKGPQSKTCPWSDGMSCLEASLACSFSTAKLRQHCEYHGFVHVAVLASRRNTHFCLCKASGVCI